MISDSALCLPILTKSAIATAMKKFFLILLLLVATGGALAAGAVGLLFYRASRELPDITRVADFQPPQATVVLARDGSIIGQFSHEKRFVVPLPRMSRFILMAVLATEDAGFYGHKGIEPPAILRAAINNLRKGRASEGGSTITQQVAKQLFLTPERTYLRKIREAVLALRIERHLTKDEILGIYLNQVFFGNGAYGVEAASRTYFGKHATDITLAESALIAGLPQAPSRFNPFRYPEAAKARQMHVLGRMRTLGWINEAEYAQASAEPLIYWSMSDNPVRGQGWYVEEVRRLLIDIFSEENIRRAGLDTRLFGEDFVYEAGLTVRTAMEPRHQDAAERALRRGLEEHGRRYGWLGPVEKLNLADGEAVRDFEKNRQDFSPYDLAGGAWAKALVTAVDQKGADVRLGSFRGRIDVRDMSWARVPNLRVAAQNAPAVVDARKVLAPGDAVWVAAAQERRSGAGSKGKKTESGEPFDPSAVKPDSVLPLALQQHPPAQGAVVSVETRSGDIVALVGGYNFGESHFNRATQSRRQPGSSFKPVVYSAAIDNGFTAATMLLDAPFAYINPWTGKIWRPENYEANFQGPMPLRTALVKSRNTCTVRVAEQIGIPAVIRRAKDLGLEPHFPNELAVSLGAVAVSPLNMARAYTAFANGGVAVGRPRMIVSVTDAAGNTLYRQDTEARRAISPQNAFIMATLLKDAVNFGTGTRARIEGRPIAGKTGTTNGENDAWFVGFSPYLCTAVYVGFDQLASLGRLEAGGRTAAPIFAYYRGEVEGDYPPDDYPMPEGVTFADVDGLHLPFRIGEPLRGTVSPQDGESSAPVSEDVFKQLF
jgi:penicillin-binding protein 1A